MSKEQVFSLDEQIEEDKKKLAELSGEETEEEAEDESGDDSEDETEEDGDKDQSVSEEKKEEPKPEPAKEPIDNAALAKVRFENSELKRRLAEAEKPKDQPKEEKIPDPTDDPIGYLAYENKKLNEKLSSVTSVIEKEQEAKRQQEFYAAQVRGFNAAEEQFKATVSDYEEVSAHMVGEMKNAFKRLYPSATQGQIDGAVANKIIQMAEEAAQRGEQPVGYLYNLSKTVYGYQPKPAEQLEEKPKKASLETIERNKKKSAHGLGGQGNKGAITADDYANMSIADMEKNANEFYSTYRA